VSLGVKAACLFMNDLLWMRQPFRVKQRKNWIANGKMRWW